MKNILLIIGIFLLIIACEEGEKNPILEPPPYEIVESTFITNYGGYMYIRGDFNNWGSSPMELVDDYQWEIIVDLSEGTVEFKFDADNNWDTADNNWGYNAWGKAIPGDGTSNIKYYAPHNGFYKISFNEQTLIFDVEAV